MEIDIFPLPSTKGVHSYIGIAFLGLIIITYIVGAYKVAQQLVGADKELLCFLVTIPIFIGGYAVLILHFMASSNACMRISRTTGRS
ncbi:MAG: hypothetical protein ACTTIF_03645 [Prevotella sp.]